MNNQEKHDEAGKGKPSITVKVNTKPVVFEVNKANGSEIKATAIAQGVQIGQDFNLFERAGNSNNWKPVADTNIVTLHPNQEFRAVAPDDNSMY
jgi:hypothetical protein